MKIQAIHFRQNNKFQAQIEEQRMIIDDLERKKIELNSRLSLRMQDTLDHSRETGDFYDSKIRLQKN